MVATTKQREKIQRAPTNTYRRLKTLRLLLLLLDALVLAFMVSNAVQVGQAAHLLQRDSAPGVIAAQQIKAALSAMNGVFATELLPSTPKEHAAAEDAYALHRTEVVRGLIDASQHIGPSSAGRQSVEDLELRLGSYERLLQHARDLQEHDSAAALALYQQAAEVLDDQLLPAADALATVSQSSIDRTVSGEYVQYAAMATVRVIASLFFLGALIIAQVFLSRRMHRTFNVALLAATLLSLLVAFHLHDTLTRAEAQLQSEKVQGFGVERQLLQARSATFAADDQARRAILDRAHQQRWEAAFAQDAAEIVTAPADLSQAQLMAALREGRAIDGFSGYLADATARRATDVDRGPVLAALQAWEDYAAAVQRTFRLEDNGQHREALTMLTGTAPGDLPRLRDKVDHELAGVSSVGQDSFDADMRSLTATARNAALEGCGTAALLAALILIGFEPRLREYRSR